MKTFSKTLVPIIEIALKESLKNYEAKNEGGSLGDLYLHYDEEESILFIYDDLENILNNVKLPKEESFFATLRYILQFMSEKHAFEKNYISKPFTVSLVDRDFSVTEELFFLDDDTVKLTGNLWKSFEKDLDEFIKNLLP